MGPRFCEGNRPTRQKIFTHFCVRGTRGYSSIGLNWLLDLSHYNWIKVSDFWDVLMGPLLLVIFILNFYYKQYHYTRSSGPHVPFIIAPAGGIGGPLVPHLLIDKIGPKMAKIIKRIKMYFFTNKKKCETKSKSICETKSKNIVASYLIKCLSN